MKIGITGAQSVGKTTLLNALRSEEKFKNYEVCDEVTRWVNKLGLQINEYGSDNTQEIILLKHVYNLTMFDTMITDRTLVDGYVYTKYLYDKGKVGSHVLKKSEHAMKKLGKQYDHIFYIRPEFDLVPDGVRSENKQFQKQICDIFEQTLAKYQDNLNVVDVTGSVRERVNQIMETVNG